MNSPQFKKRRPANTAVGDYPPSLVRSYFELELSMQPGSCKAGLLRKLNDICETKHLTGQMYNWLNLKHEPERSVRIYMLHCVLAHVLASEGFDVSDTRKIDRIASKII